jgi:Contractile injection system tube protein
MATATAPSGLEKAYLSFLEPKPSGTRPSTTVNGASRVEFKFNPKEYSIQKSAEWTRKPATGAKQTSPPEFTGSQPRQLSLEMFLDESESSGDVSRDIETLFACLTPLPRTLSDQKPVPPFVQFGWGRKVLFTAFLKSVSARYTLFRPDGSPIRAVCTVSL